MPLECIYDPWMYRTLARIGLSLFDIHGISELMNIRPNLLELDWCILTRSFVLILYWMPRFLIQHMHTQLIYFHQVWNCYAGSHSGRHEGREAGSQPRWRRLYGECNSRHWLNNIYNAVVKPRRSKNVKVALKRHKLIENCFNCPNCFATYSSINAVWENEKDREKKPSVHDWLDI